MELSKPEKKEARVIPAATLFPQQWEYLHVKIKKDTRQAMDNVGANGWVFCGTIGFFQKRYVFIRPKIA